MFRQTVCLWVQLQQDADFQHWNVDFGAVHQRAKELGIDLIRRPVCIPLAHQDAIIAMHVV